MIARMDRTSLTAALVALLWLLGAFAGAFPILAAVAVAGLLLPACWAVRRRDGARRQALVLGLAVTGLVLAALLAWFRPGTPTGPWTLGVEVAALAVGSLTVPFLYALTFPSGEDRAS